MVVNPVKVTDLDEFRRTVDGALAAAGWPAPTWYETTVEDPGRGQTEQAVEAGAEVVFACGGDGTVMACVTALAGTDVALAVLPQGTGNLLAANLGPLQRPGRRAGGRRRTRAAAGSTSASVDDQCFAVMAGMGFDAQMLDATSETTKARIGWPAYVVGAAAAPAGPADAGLASGSTTSRRCAAGPAPSWSPTSAGCRAGYACSPTPSRTTAGSTWRC